MSLLGRDVVEVDALVTDRYLDALLASGELASLPGGRREAGPGGGRRGLNLDTAVRLASARLTRDLPRFHPSFRFEERLAVRLAEAAAAMRLPSAGGAEGSVAVLPTSPFAPADDFDPLAGRSDSDPDRGPEGADIAAVPRPLLIGGAVAASALSLAGAAWVAWRRSRVPGSSPMARAARAAHAMRGRPA
jgi:hypothetical protein